MKITTHTRHVGWTVHCYPAQDRHECPLSSSVIFPDYDAAREAAELLAHWYASETAAVFRPPGGCEQRWVDPELAWGGDTLMLTSKLEQRTARTETKQHTTVVDGETFSRETSETIYGEWELVTKRAPGSWMMSELGRDVPVTSQLHLDVAAKVLLFAGAAPNLGLGILSKVRPAVGEVCK